MLGILMPRLRKSARLMLLGIALMITACTAIPETVTDVSCDVFRPITYSGQNDTPETIEQIRGHNAAWDAICEEE